MLKRAIAISILITFNYLNANDYFYDIFSAKLANKELKKSYCMPTLKANVCSESSILFNEKTSHTKLPYRINFDLINKTLKENYNNLDIKKEVEERITSDEMLFAKYYYNSENKLYAINKNSFVFYNTSGGYSGGAHGYFGLSYKNYTKDHKLIKLKDLFIADYNKTLNDIALKAYKNYRGLKHNQSLVDDCWFENSFVLAKEFAITPNGLEFYYNNYEVMPYACGQVAFVIPYRDLEPIISKNSVLNEFLTPKKNEYRYFLDEKLGYIKLTFSKINKDTINLKASIRAFDYFNNIWFSISLPQFSSKRVISNLKSKNFLSAKVYQRGDKIYNIKKKKAIKANYLLIEGSKKGNDKNSYISFNVNIKNIKDLKVYIRASFKEHSKQKELKTMPMYSGKVGQQGFFNYFSIFRAK
jgi:hypothetical protein